MTDHRESYDNHLISVFGNLTVCTLSESLFALWWLNQYVYY